MAQHYSDPKRESDPHALPDIEVWHHSCGFDASMPAGMDEADCEYRSGWYWWSCFPGCLPDGEPSGPFETEADALADARDGLCDDLHCRACCPICKSGELYEEEGETR
jgi:hypothetical protein